jgi:ABC-type antimicrobial peptide transport system permease subunit
MRTILAVLGITIIALSLVLLTYALWPGGTASTAREQYRLAPTVFVPPQ